MRNSKQAIRSGGTGWSATRDAVLIEFADLADGDSVRGELCPACAGGDSGEGSLSVTRTDGVLLWNCYRASCGFKGAAGSHSHRRQQGGKGEGVPSQRVSRGSSGRVFIRDSERLPEYVKESLAASYSFDEQHLTVGGLGWSAKESRVVLPVYSRSREERGATLRAIDGRTPKSISWVDDGAIGWYMARAGKPSLVLVEDQFSAIRAARYVDSVALLGTNLNDDRVSEIAERGYNRVYLALDKDAFSLAVNYIIALRSKLPLHLLRLDKDIKNHTPNELDELMKEVER